MKEISIKPKKILKENEIELIRRTKDNYTHNVFEDLIIEEITTWKTSQKKIGNYYLYNILSFGIIYIVTKFKPLLFIKLYCIPSAPKEAEYFLVKNIYGEYKLCIKQNKKIIQMQDNHNISEDISNQHILGITTNNNPNVNDQLLIGFDYNSKFYEYNEILNKIMPMYFNLTYLSNRKIYQLFSDGLSSENKVKRYKERYGLNIYPFNIRLVSYYYLRVELVMFIISFIILFLEALAGDRFYFLVSLVCIVIISVYQLIVLKKLSLDDEYTLDGEKKQIKVRRKYMADKNKEYCYINNIDLLPGDLIYLKRGELSPCDGIILEGECIINLSGVNGKICEVKKKALENNIYQFNYKSNKSSILYHGTKILKSYSKLENNYILLLCINTGGNTYKANQLANINYIFNRNKKYKEIYSKLCGKKYTLFCHGLFLLIFSSIIVFLISFYKKNKNLQKAFNKDMIFIILSFLSRSFVPGFHVISSGIILLSIKYLANEKIKVYDKSRLLYAGGINTVFFDKTGTLSEENLEIIGFLPICMNQNSSEFFLKYYTLNQIKEISSILINYYSSYFQDEQDLNNTNNTIDEKKINEIPKKMATLFLECMLCCNNLEKINNKLVGNFLEKEILSKIKWQLKIVSDDNDKKSNDQSEVDKDKDKDNDDKKKVAKNLSVQSNFTDNFSFYCKNGNNSKYKVKISEQKLDVYPNDYYKIVERKKVVSKSIVFRENSSTKDLISQSNDLSDKKKSSSKTNQIIEDITRNTNYSTYKLRIYKRFIKVGTLYSSSIVYNPIIKTLYFMTKGPPEDIIPYCDYNFLPKDINKIITLYRKNGYINLILALKIINECNYDKSLGEDYYMSDLIFCGIIILKNKLKKDVKQVIQQLKNMNCDIILSTGDNIYNSVTVSYESGITSKKNIYVFDLNKMTQKITLINFNEITNEELLKYNSNINNNLYSSININNNIYNSINYTHEKWPITKVKSKLTSSKLISSHKMKHISNKLDKLSAIFVKEGTSTPKLESEIKVNIPSPYHTEKIQKLNQTNEVPQMELNEIKNNFINRIKDRRRINVRESNMRIISINSKSELLLEKSSDRQINNSIDRKNDKIGFNDNFISVASNSIIDIPNNLPVVVKNKNKLRSSTVLKNSINQKIMRQNSKKLERKRTKNLNFGYIYESKISNEYYSSRLKSMRDDCVYCVSGRALKFIYENRFNPEYEKYEFAVLLNHIKKFGKIFYEMKSKDKSFLIDYFRTLPNKITCMVGDGQNDIDAIMTSHVGININQPVNMNTVLCHFSPLDGSLFCIEKIIRYGRVVYENIYLLGVSSFACTMILTMHIIIIYYEGIEIIKRQVDFLNYTYFILLVLAFYIKPDVLAKPSPLFHNPSLYKKFFMIISLLNLFINFIYTMIFSVIFIRNKQISHEKERKIFGTYNFFFTFVQLFGMIFSMNSISFYRLPQTSNTIFWISNIFIGYFLAYVFCICGYSFHPFLYGIITFEFSSKNVDAFDDQNKLKSFLIFSSDLIFCYLNVYIFFLIFSKKAERELEKEKDNIVKVKIKKS